MTNLTENETWEEGIYQIELVDPVVGGPDGISNRQAKQLANRTTWLKAQIDALLSGVVSAYKATRLATARTLSITGAGTGSASFDGSANAAIALTLADSGVAAGSYPKVTVNAKGLVTGGAALAAADIPSLPWSKITTGKPTTLAGYGITDALAAVNFTWGNLTEKPTSLGGYGITDAVLSIMSGDWAVSDTSRVMRSGTNGPMGTTIVGGLKAIITADNIHTNFAGRAGRAFFQTMGDADSAWHEINAWSWITGKPTTLGGYGITDAVASSNFTFANLGGKPTTIAGYGINFATQPEAEAGADTNKPMNALRVFQAIAAKVIQATESVLGIARIATQIQVDAGTDDTTIVTPKKLRLGVTYSFGTNGYIFLPQWLGGFGIQWVVGPAFTSGTNQVVNFPVPWPNAPYGTWIEQASGSAEVNWSPSALNVNSVTVYCHGPSTGTPRIIAIGR